MLKIKHYIIPVFVPHLGCPHDCVFCNQREITGQEEEVSLLEVEDMIDSYLIEIGKTNIEKTVEIAFYGGSFTGIEFSLQEEYLKIAYKKKELGLIDGIRLSTRPDYINNKIIKLLKKYGVTEIELGVQSLDLDVLTKSNRGHSIDDVKKSTKLIKESGFKLGLQMMIGLPGDTGKESIKTCETIIELGADFVRIYPTLIIKNTELEIMYNKNLYKPLSLEKAVLLSTDIYLKFLKANITVIRIGLQPTDDLSDKISLVAGPFHPSFRQLVESQVYRRSLENFLKDYDEINSLEIYINSKEISNIVGMKKSNMIYLEEKYKIKKIKIYESNIEKNKYHLKIDGKLIACDKITY